MNGINPAHIAGTNFVMLHLDLLDDLDGDFYAALLFDRIKFRAGTDGWWTATRAQVLEDTRLTEAKFKRALQKLRDAGYVQTERVAAYDARLRYGVIIAAIPEMVKTTAATEEMTTHAADTAVSEMVKTTVSTSIKNSEEQDKNNSPDGEVNPIHLELCQLLETRIRENGSTTHHMNKSWLTAVRLMIEKDGRTVDDIRGCIEWCQKDEFWRMNILSMGKLRKQFDQMRLRAEQKSGMSRQQKWLELYAKTVDNEKSQTLQLEG